MNIELDKLTKIGDWLLEKSTIFTGVFAALGCLSMLVAIALKLPYFGMPEAAHHTLDDLGKYALGFWGVLAFTSLLSQMKKNAKQAAAIAAEQIRRNPDVPDASAVPAVHKEIVKQAINGDPTAP
jgi:hypothetical protein